MKTLVAGLAATLAIAPLAAKAEETEKTVQGLYLQCKNNNSPIDGSFYFGYVTAVSDRLVIDRKFCSTVTYGAIVQAFINWAEKHPDAWGFPRLLGVEFAIFETWPCK